MRRDWMSIPGWILILVMFVGIGSNAWASAVDEFFTNIDSVVFIVDVTGEPGSGTQSLTQMKTLLVRALSKLEPDCSFSLLSNDGTGTISLGTRMATAENVSEAIEWIEGLSPVSGQDIFQAVCESGVPPYDECMTFVLFTRGVVNSIYWETDQPTTTNILSAFPEGSKFTSIKIPGVDHEFTAMFLQLCQELAESTGGRVIILE